LARETLPALDPNLQTRFATLPASGDPDLQAIAKAGIVIALPGHQVVCNRVTFPVFNRTGIVEMTFTWETSF
jgi:hypothetical protein